LESEKRMEELSKTRADKKGLWAWAFYDWANSAYPTVIQTFVFAAYFTRQIAVNDTVGSSQWGNTISLAGLAVAILGPFIGAIADQGGRRKPWIAVFSLLCIIPTGLLWWAYPSNEVLIFALLMVGLSTVGSEFSYIFYNAMLPDLADKKTMGRWSGWAWGLGYAGGLVCLIVALYGLINPEGAWLGLSTDNAEHVRATFVLVAIWYAVFALPMFWYTPDRPSTFKSLKQSIRDGWEQITTSIHHVRQYRDILRFLVARLFYIDGLATVFAFGGIYAAGAFDMTEKDVLIFGIGLNVTAGLGAAAFAWLDDALGSKTTINLALVGLILSCASILWVESITLFWVFGLILGIFVGPVQAASRTYMAHLAPEELRNQMFGLFALSGKVTAFMGPFLVGQLTLFSGSQRIGMSVIIGFFLVGAWLMWGLPSVQATTD
jgi:UMF1 family MFS transporter